MSRDSLPRTSGARHAVATALGVGYGVVLAFIVFWPSPVDRPIAAMLQRVIAELHERGVPQFVDYALIEFSANVLLFFPVGVFFGLAVPIRWWVLALAAGPMLSAIVELAQARLLAERYATVSDVVANSIGATIGVLLMLALRAAVARRDQQVIARHEALAAARA